jgi:hypothetical protein
VQDALLSLPIPGLKSPRFQFVFMVQWLNVMPDNRPSSIISIDLMAYKSIPLP